MAQASEEAARIRRESEYHDRDADNFDPASALVDESFTAVTAIANQHFLRQYGDVRGKRVLDYGCGAAEGGIYLAKLGARVVGMDVSRGQLDNAEKLAAFHGVKIETRLVTDTRIPADDREFDFIYGNGVLHHVPLDSAVPELARVLAPTGKGCFMEPLPYNPLIEVYRKLATQVRTEDERPLSWDQIASLGRNFDVVEHREVWFSTLAVFLKFFLIDRVHPNDERYWKKIITDAESVRWLFSPLQALDDRLLKLVPPLRKLCWLTLITLAGPKHAN
ncbi:MAG TPA: class I SAM-dependent methyltransferase [Polyangia bacterium]|nr:class I SAM-dependent methyltransferase [Polyangia bacterium]